MRESISFIELNFFFKLNCKQLEDVESFNVIGEIKGTTHPEEIMVVGGHLDSWDLGDGAHDDGAGCVQGMEVLRLFKATGYKPKRTLRVVLFMNEENGLRGGNKYAEEALAKKERRESGGRFSFLKSPSTKTKPNIKLTN